MPGTGVTSVSTKPGGRAKLGQAVATKEAVATDKRSRHRGAGRTCPGPRRGEGKKEEVGAEVRIDLMVFSHPNTSRSSNYSQSAGCRSL